jgi:hypothetical protein
MPETNVALQLEHEAFFAAMRMFEILQSSRCLETSITHVILVIGLSPEPPTSCFF